MGNSTILIVDDEEQIRESLVEYLQLLGHRTKSAPDAQSALQHVGSGLDLVITDQRLPGMSGLQLIQEIRKLNQQVPVFLMTGYPDLPTVQEAKVVGAVAFLKKPLDLKGLGNRVNELLGKPDGKRSNDKLLLLSQGLSDRLGEKLSWCETRVYEGEEDVETALEAINREKPTAILGDVKSQFTLQLLDEYRRQKQDYAAFLVAGDESDLDLLAEAIFERRGDGGITVDDDMKNITRIITGCVERLEGEKERARQMKETLVERCMYARPFQRGRHCTYQGPCPFREGWVVIHGTGHQKCGKKPLEFADWDRVGLYTWPAGPVTLEKLHEARREVGAMIKHGKKEIVFDLTNVKVLHFNLFEVFSDLSEELIAAHHDGKMTVINLDPQFHREFLEFTNGRGIRLHT